MVTTASDVYQGVNYAVADKKLMRGTAWTKEEDDLLLHLRARNVDYDIISEQYIPRHSPAGCGCRHFRMKNKIIIAADGTQTTAGAAAAAAVAAAAANNGQNEN